MPNIIDIFNDDAFSLVSLTEKVNAMPFKPGMIGEMGIFEEKGVNTVAVAFEENAGVLKLVQSSPRGGVAQQHTPNKGKVRTVRSVHLATEDTVQADEIQGVRIFGADGSNELASAQAVVNDRLAEMTGNLDVTLEAHRLGAIKGQVLDADGSVLHDLFDVFGVAQDAVVDFNLDNSAPGIKKITAAIRRSMAKRLGALAGSQFAINALCGDDFFDALVNHAECKEAYDRYENGQALREDVTYGEFVYGGVKFINYRGSDDGSVGIGVNDVHLFPAIPGLYKTYYSPADVMDAVNTIGLPRYAMQSVDKDFGRFVKLHAQSNPLNVCLRPQVLIKGKRT